MRRQGSALMCAVAALYLLLQVRYFCSEVLQLDLSAYRAAAEAQHFGLDPYRTHPDHLPPVWDGVSAYTHSRFLYPPLVADLFLPLTLVPYALAKWIFTALSLGALIASVLMAWRQTRPAGPSERERLWLLLAFVLSAYPVLALLERGQVDAFTLLLLVAAWAPALRGSRPGLLSGFLLALAMLLKLNAAYLALFWALRRWWRGLLGFALGVAALLLVSAAVDGPAALGTYLRRELPRIARYGEDGSPAMRLPAETYGRLRGDAPEGFVIRDGCLYRVEGFGFVANASGARVVPKLMGAYRARAWFSLVSLLIVAGAVGLLAWALPRRHLDPLGELAFLAASLAAVLLAGPLTWAMNAVWLATGGILLALAWPSPGARPSLALLGLGFGLFLAWLPDQYALVPVFGSPPTGLGDYKYVVGELTVLVCAAIFVRLGGRKDTGPGNGPD